jgi:hypothetical protein
VRTKSNSAYWGALALALSTLEHFVEHSRGHRDNDQARDQGREKRVAEPEPVVGEVPDDRPGKDEHTEAADDPRRAHVCPKRIGAARTDSATSHLPPSILRHAERAQSYGIWLLNWLGSK